MEIQVFLERRQIDDPEPPHVVGAVLAHDFAGALHHPGKSGDSDEHVVRFLGEHEPAGARQGIECGLGERVELKLAVAVGEEGEHEQREPVRGPLVEGGEDARPVGIAGAAFEQRLRLLAPVAAEVGVQQVDHGPEVASFLDVDLEEVAQVVARGAGTAEMALLLDRSGFGVTLDNDQPAQRRPVVARHPLPDRLALVVAEADAAVRLGVCEKDAPAIVRHPGEAEVRPAAAVDRRGGAQIHLRRAARHRPHLPPPVEKGRLPLLQRAPQAAIGREIDVVGDALVQVDG